MTHPMNYDVQLVVNDSEFGELKFFLDFFTTEQVDDLKLRLYGDIRAQHELYATDDTITALREWCDANLAAGFTDRFAEYAKRNGRFELRILVKD